MVGWGMVGWGSVGWVGGRRVGSDRVPGLKSLAEPKTLGFSDRARFS